MMAGAARAGRGVRTRERLIQAGRELFAERPVDAVTIDDIVRAADVAKGSFYNHFADREALVVAVVSEIRDGVERAVDAANDGETDAARRLVGGLCVYLRYAVDEPLRARVLARVSGGVVDPADPQNRGLAADLELGLASGRFAIATLESALLFVMGVTQAALARTCRDPDAAAAVARAQQVGALVLRGMGVPFAEADAIAAQAADAVVRRRD